ncbi:DNA polymerase IV [Candidatus Nitrosotenuis uzonensis]|uniref:DNA polymerase IV n=1 Tax=Candidatus Nitrosotenuis uzonensis TaxID=1407055 RepID=UPI00064E22EF|nr:DNA polymerase IV [Candidatus Nitrosotenuis uzonensis]
MDKRIVFHIDFDYFFAQCEEIRNQSLKTRPVAVCIFSDRGGDSGAIATANYIARKYGVKSGMPIKFAKARLATIADAVFLPADFTYYSDISERAMEIIRNHADIFEYVGKDEAYLDVSLCTDGDFQKAAHHAQQLKNKIRDEVKLTCSIGVSPNKIVSKIASGFRKPDGLTVVEPANIESFLNPLKIGDIPGIGKVTEEKFAEIGIKTIKELKEINIFTLNKMFGRKISAYIYNAAKGIDDEPVAQRQPTIQYSKITTLKEDSRDFNFLAANLDEICTELHNVVLKNGKMFKSVGIQFVQSDLSNKTKSRMLRNPTSSIDELKKTAMQLLQEALTDQSIDVRRLGVKVSELSDFEGQSSITNFF